MQCSVLIYFAIVRFTLFGLPLLALAFKMLRTTMTFTHKTKLNGLRHFVFLCFF